MKTTSSAQLQLLVRGLERSTRIFLPYKYPRQSALDQFLLFILFPWSYLVLRSLKREQNLHSLTFWAVALSSLAVASWAFMVWHQRYGKWRDPGWRIDFAQRTLTPKHIAGAKPQSINHAPHEYSLGCYQASDSRAQRAWLLELRHKRAGPVAALSYISDESRGGRNPEWLELLDKMTDLLANKLGVMRSGAPLPVPKNRVTAND